VAYFWFLAVFPLLIAGVGLLGLVHAGPRAIAGIENAIREVLPGDAGRVLTQVVESATSDAAPKGLLTAVVGIAVALWSASSGMSAVQLGLDIAYDIQLSRPWLKRHLMGVGLVLAALVLGGAATALLVFGQPLGDLIQRHVPFGGSFLFFWTAGRWLLTVLAVMTLYALFYYLAPHRPRPRWKWITPGGVLAGVIWLASSFGLSFYVSSFGGSYATTYGSLVGVVALVLWLYLSALALLLGGELNGELEGRAAAERESDGAGPAEEPADSVR
jgi:membrane protein